MTTLLLVDDHPVVREGLAAMLSAEADLEVVGEAGNGEEALAIARQRRPDVVLMDLRMPGTDGVEATLRFGAELPGCRVLVLTTYDSDTDIVRAVEAGAAGYLLKDTPRRDLAEAVRAAARGETVLAPPVAAKLVGRMQQGGRHEVVLTEREHDVLSQLALGLTNAEIGRRLYIGESTVKTHLLEIFAKLGVDNRTRAVTIAIERGLLGEPGAHDGRADGP